MNMQLTAMFPWGVELDCDLLEGRLSWERFVYQSSITVATIVLFQKEPSTLQIGRTSTRMSQDQDSLSAVSVTSLRCSRDRRQEGNRGSRGRNSTVWHLSVR